MRNTFVDLRNQETEVLPVSKNLPGMPISFPPPTSFTKAVWGDGETPLQIGEYWFNFSTYNPADPWSCWHPCTELEQPMQKGGIYAIKINLE